MWPLAYRLRSRGFNCQTWSYNSLRGSIQTHADAFSRFLNKLVVEGQEIHLVAHSLGSIVVRTAFRIAVPTSIQHVVFLAPPNAGSFAARRAARFLGGLIPTIDELTDGSSSFVNQLPAWTGSSLGIVAARYDWVIGLNSTRLTNQSASKLIDTTHAGLLVSKAAADSIAQFLATGRF